MTFSSAIFTLSSNDNKVKNEVPKVEDKSDASQASNSDKPLSQDGEGVSKVMEDIKKNEEVVKKGGRRRKDVKEEPTLIKKNEVIITKSSVPKVKKVKEVKQVEEKKGMSLAFKAGIAVGVVATMFGIYFVYMKIKEQRKNKFVPGDVPLEDTHDTSTVEDNLEGNVP